MERYPQTPPFGMKGNIEHLIGKRVWGKLCQLRNSQVVGNKWKFQEREKKYHSSVKEIILTAL